MRNRLYVGNLSYNAVVEDLKTFFSACGNVVDARIITDRETGNSKGFGFIEFATEEDAEAAIKELDGIEFYGRPLRVNIAEDKRQNGGEYRAPQGGPTRNFNGGSQGNRRPSNGYQGHSNYGSQDSSEGRGNNRGPKRRGGGGRRHRDDDMDWG
jgi:RNA recognition motif-containing protein